MPDISRLSETTLASMLKGEIGKRHRWNPVSFDLPDDRMLARLAKWAKKAALEASGMGGIGYSLHRTGSVEVITQNYLRMEYCRKGLETTGGPAQSPETLGKMALVGGIVVFIWGTWDDLSPKASNAVVKDFATHPADYQLPENAFPFTRDEMQAAIPTGRRVAG